MGQTLRINWVLDRATLSGGVKSNRLIAEAMVRRGHQVSILYVDLPRPAPPPWRVRTFWRYQKQQRQAKREGGGRPKHHLMQSTATLLPIQRRPIEARDVPDADVTIATWWETAEWVRDWPASKGVKAYFVRHHELHGGDPERVKATYRQPMLKLVIAKWLQRLMQEDYGDPNSVLVPNGVDQTQFSFVPREKQAVPTVGMLYGKVKWKGADTAFDALRLAQRQCPELRVVAFGSHPIEPHHVPPANFEYHFRPAQVTIPELYRQADAWLVPSTLEGFGMPGLEAAACGCPLVVTRCGGAEDYLEEGVNGRLVPVGDAQAMAAALLELVGQDAPAWQAMSRASESISQQFDWDRSAGILEEALWEAVQGVREPVDGALPGSG